MKRLEEIVVWQKARKLAGEVYRATREGDFSRDFGLRDQVRRSAVSVMANIAEGYGRRTKKDFASFLYTAKGSAIETISHLYLAVDLDYVDKDTFEALYREYDELVGMLVNFIKSLRPEG